jgi:hypothetical protein
VDFKAEASFDPRGVLRYLLGFRPDGSGAPHFTGDPLKVDFCIDHLQQLLQGYGRALRLALRRTDPEPGSLKGFVRPGDLPMTVQAIPLDKLKLSPQDGAFIEAFEAAPCVIAPKLGGSSLQVSDAALQAGAQYDLLLLAPPLNNPDPANDGVLIARSGFRASRYSGHAQLVAALGFHQGAANAILAADMLLAGTLPTPAQAAKDSDSALEATLQALGLAPWPVTHSARSVLLWKAGPAPTLAGMLLEADEPIQRKGRFTVDKLLVMDGAVVKASYECVRSNAAGTRLLFSSAQAFTPAAQHTLALQGTVIGADGAPTPFTAARHLTAKPRALLQEVA